MISLWLIVFFILFAGIGPLFVSYSYDEQVRGSENLVLLEYSGAEKTRMADGYSPTYLAPTTWGGTPSCG